MIHPMVLVFVIIVILSICFAVIYLFAELYSRSEVRRHGLERDRYDTAVEVAVGETYAIRDLQNDEGLNNSAFLTIISPKSHNLVPETMGSPACIHIETDAKVMDEIAVSWIQHRGLTYTR
ncbi:hypothetical protein [Marinobacter sediminicola]|uniref:hypothetical protein n=1 Tax=Marinobacter sediminicola TaxID=3072994 RepID=UPI002603C4E3|nr:hypothetical protein [Marinobacter sp. F26243]